MNNKLSQNAVAFYTIFHREVTRFIRIWSQTLLPSMITMSLYFLIFGNLIGPRIGNMDEVPYTLYITPGLIVLAVITNSYSNVAGSLFGSRFQRNIDELLITPTANITILLGFVLGGCARGILVGIGVLLVAEFFTDLQFHSLAMTFVFIFLASMLFALMGFANAVFARKFDDIAIIPTFVITPLTYLGGVFYTISLLPNFWQNVSKFNPVLYIVNSIRHAMLGISDINVTVASYVICFFIILLFAINLILMRKGVGLRS